MKLPHKVKKTYVVQVEDLEKFITEHCRKYDVLKVRDVEPLLVEDVLAVYQVSEGTFGIAVGDDGYWEEKITLSHHWLPGLVEILTRYKKISECLKETKL